MNLGPILDHLPAWLMVLFRLTGIFLLTPVFGSAAIPRTVKMFMVLAISLCVYPMLIGTGNAGANSLFGMLRGEGLSLWTLGPMIGVELLIGYVIGYCVTLPLVGVQLGGQVIDQQMGLSAGGVFNPELDSQASVIEQLLFMTSLMVFLMIGGHHAVLLTLIGSFETIPLGQFGMAPPPEAIKAGGEAIAGMTAGVTSGGGSASGGGGLGMDAVVDFILGLLNVTFEMGLRIAAPMLCILFLLRVAMGFIGRTVPQMNILSVGFIIYILAGMMVLIVGIGTVLVVFRTMMTETLQQLLSIFTM